VVSPPPGDDRDDQALLAAHVAGEDGAFGELIRRHRNRLWAVAFRTLGDPEDAADALQDACVSAYRGARGFRADSAVTTWLHRIVVNACLDLVRRRRARPTVPLSAAAEERGAGEQDGGESADTVVTRLDVRQALAALPFEQRAALVLVDLEGHSVADAAAVLGIAEGTVKSRCARGRARLAVLLGHVGPDGGNPAGPAPVPRRSRRTGEGR
jgi:RNA polymerase sigma-70 factor (ECF subfamily)